MFALAVRILPQEEAAWREMDKRVVKVMSSCLRNDFLIHSASGPGRWRKLIDLGNLGRRQAREQIF